MPDWFGVTVTTDAATRIEDKSAARLAPFRYADIRTGDEFEELSQAYNRMLRHLVAVQEELRQVNTALDSKVDELAQAKNKIVAIQPY